MPTLVIIGSGNIGTALARLAAGAGIPVVVANSRGPQSLAGLILLTRRYPSRTAADTLTDHAVAVSHHDATHIRAGIEHHVAGRNSIEMVDERSQPGNGDA